MSPAESAIQDRPDDHQANRVRLYAFEVRDLGFALIAVACVIAAPIYLAAAASGEWLRAVAISLAMFGFFAVPLCLTWLLASKHTEVEIEISADRLRVLDADRPRHVRTQWVEYRRSGVDSVTLQNGLLTVSDRSGQPLIRRQTGRKAEVIRQALEHHHWC